ncbi:MAG TPA: hypothetical protein VKH19_02440 [Gemmatimonadaceae bacterium]|nr:hypothetical protein [Gemmatimonadaceae bacterium]
MSITRRSDSWTLWHLLAFWAIWFAIASGFSWIIVGGAVWRVLADGSRPSLPLVAGRIPTSFTILLALFWSFPILAAVRWSYRRLAGHSRRAPA